MFYKMEWEVVAAKETVGVAPTQRLYAPEAFLRATNRISLQIL